MLEKIGENLNIYAKIVGIAKEGEINVYCWNYYGQRQRV